ncbi:hypothetical protein TNCV_17771 [Trichonephila clavipes]|nr:hypothetical protein TNCV_17771 [Trichonephila clavipes]
MFTVQRTIGGANTCSFQAKANEAIDALRTFHSAVNSIEWYKWTPKEAYQTESVVLWSVMCLHFHHCPAHNTPVITGSGATRWVRSAPSVSLHPAMPDPHHSLLV